jgi:HK97 family phage portal protein
MGIVNLLRATIPRGTREPEPAPWPTAHTPWWGPWGSLPWASDGSVQPTVVNTYGDAEAAALAIPAAWRATNLIAGFIAQMPLNALDGNPPEHIDTSKQLLNNPWPVISYFDWMFSAVTSVVLRGNFYAVKTDFDEATGNPRQLIPISSDDVTVNYEKGRLTYRIVGVDHDLSWMDVFHVRGFMMPGMLTGVGVIEAHRAGLRATRELMDYGAGAYSSGAIPPVVMRVDKPELTEEEAEYLQSRWVQRHNSRDRRPAVIPKIVELEKVGLSMQDAEYLESRQFSIAEVAFMFNLDPEDLSASLGAGKSGRIEYQNIEAKMRDRLVFSLQPWMSRFEQAYAMDLPGNAYARFNTNELFRADSYTRMRTYDLALRNQIFTLPEVRMMERMPIKDYDMQTPHGVIPQEAPGKVTTVQVPFAPDGVPTHQEMPVPTTAGAAPAAGNENGQRSQDRDFAGKFAPGENGKGPVS